MHEFPADDSRLAELILYVSSRCSDRDGFDPVLLDRILFQADFLHYRNFGVPITGQTYRRGPCGPTPRGLSRVLRGLAREFAIVETPEGDGLHVRRRPEAMRAARLSAFSARELATVEEVLGHYLAGLLRNGSADGRTDGKAEGSADRGAYAPGLWEPVGAGRRGGDRGKARTGPSDYLEVPWQEAGPRAILPYSLALAACESAGGAEGRDRLAACPA